MFQPQNLKKITFMHTHYSQYGPAFSPRLCSWGCWDAWSCQSITQSCTLNRALGFFLCDDNRYFTLRIGHNRHQSKKECKSITLSPYLSWVSLKFWKIGKIQCQDGKFWGTMIKTLMYTRLYGPSTRPYHLPSAAPVWLRWYPWGTALQPKVL